MQDDTYAAYSWTRCWWPVAPLEALQTDGPNPFTLLGKDFVVFQGPGGQWSMLDDRCPHRLSALSEGKRFHRWQIEGTCARDVSADW